MNDRVISRIRKMIALANDAGATEGERDNALRMAHATLVKHNLDITSIDGEATAAQEQRVQEAGVFHGVPWARTICHSIAKLFFCKYFSVRFSANTDDKKHYFVGRTSNATTAMHLAQFVVEAVNREAKAYTRGQHYSVYRAFGAGAANRIYARCEKLRAAQEAAPPPELLAAPGTALVLASVYAAEAEANDAYLKAAGRKLTTHRGGAKVYDRDAHAAGTRFGDGVTLSPFITGSQQKKLT